MNNKVVNKQIPLETIVKVANHLEDYKKKYFDTNRIVMRYIGEEKIIL